MKNITQTIFIPPGSREEFAVFDAQRSREWPDRTVTLSGVSELAPGYRVRRTEPDFHLVLFVTGGELEVRRGGFAVTAHPGDAVFLPAGEAHEYWSEKAFAIVWFHLNRGVPEWANLESEPAKVVHSEHLPVLPALVRTLVREASPLSGDAVLLKLTCQMIQRLLERELGSAGQVAELRRRLSKAFSTAFLRMAHPWRIAELARLAGISEPYFFAATREIYGRTPGRILTEARLEKAAALLRATGCKLDSAAEQTGFGGGFALSRAFRRFYGVSPSEWRAGKNGSIKSKTEQTAIPSCRA